MREQNLRYLPKIEQEVTDFIHKKIKVDYLNPSKEVSLTLSIRDAEILVSANPDLKAMAEKGELKALHDRFAKLEGQVEADYLKVRDLLSRIQSTVHEKENEIYD
jgi:hypothetical protein